MQYFITTGSGKTSKKADKDFYHQIKEDGYCTALPNLEKITEKNSEEKKR
jgi:hypothetical protein